MRIKSIIKRLLALVGLKLVRLPEQPREDPLSPARIAAIAECLNRTKSVDFVDIRGMGVFVLEDDLYQYLPEESKRQSIPRFLKRHPEWEQKKIEPGDWIGRIVQYFVDNDINPVVLDIGGHWGVFSFEVARSFRQLGTPGEIVCFEAGVTAPLIEASIEINGFEDLISVRNIAVSDRNGPTLFYMNDQHSQSNALIRHIHHNYAKLAYSVDIRDVLREHAHASAFFIKIDTEGMEESIIRAAESEEIPGQTIYVFEMAFGAPREELLGFLTYLSQRFVIYDLPRQKQIPDEQFEALVDDLINRPARFTDLLCLPIGHPLNDDFCPAEPRDQAATRFILEPAAANAS